jgi:hypothetical protein
MRILETIGDVEINICDENQLLTFTAGATIDGDGAGGNKEHDPCFQSDTSLHYKGKPLNSRVDKFIVLPIPMFKQVKPVLLGSAVVVQNTNNGKVVNAVVGDKGPSHHIGEISIALAEALEIPSDPNKGGIEAHILKYEVHMGVPAVVDGKTYELTPTK